MNFKQEFLLIILVATNILCFGQEVQYSIKTDQYYSKNLSYSSDNRYFAFSNENKVLLYKPSSEQIIKELNFEIRELKGFAFSEANTQIIGMGKSLSGRANILESRNIDSGNLNYTIPLNKSDITAFSLHPEKRFLILGFKNETIEIWNLDSRSLDITLDVDEVILDIAFSQDGGYFATGGNKNQVKLYNFDSRETVNTFSHEDWVQDLEFSNNNKLLASTGLDGNLYLTDLGNNYETSKLSRSGKVWYYSLAFSSDDQYVATGSDEKGVHLWNVGDRQFSSELKIPKDGTFRSIVFNQSGKLLASANEFEKDVKLWDVGALNITPQFDLVDTDDKTPPQIYLSSPANLINDRINYSEEIIQIKGLVIDDSGIQSLAINGIKTPVRQNGDFVINLPLTMGDNFISIEVKDINQNIALKKFIINRRDPTGGEYDPENATNHLFIVGIDKYQNWPLLNNAVKDANEVLSTLISQYNFEIQNITIIKDEQATRSNIYNGLRGLIEKIGPNDNLILYYSGHGYLDELLNEGYWVPVDAKKSDPGEYISNSDILNIIKNINSQHTFLIADACFSGSLFLDTGRGYADNVEKFKSRWALASGRLEVVSDGSVGSNSPFASSLIRFLRENEKDKVAVSELIQFVKLQVSEISDQTPIGNPLKNVGDEGGEFVFYKR